MTAEEIALFTTLPSIPIVEALDKIDRNARGLLFVIDENNVLIGCLTDGDVRRWILKGGDVHAEVFLAMNTTPGFVYEDEKSRIVQLTRQYLFTAIPVCNRHRQIIDIVLNFDKKIHSDVEHVDLKGFPIVIMAGGRGTRLYPYTKILPKPLIPIGDVPILERILNRFYQYGADEFYITVNYKKEIIKFYFAEQKPEYRIHYVEEDIPLGTAGSIRLIDKRFRGPVLVTNCDIIIEADYGSIIRYHKTSGNDMTIVSSMKNTPIPYGVLHAKEGGIITAMEEKPQLSHFINTGMYVVEPDFFEWIPENEVFHMTDLANLMIQKGRQVGMYPISENSFWDMGEFEELKKMEERIRTIEE